MSDAIVSALITGLLALAGVIITNHFGGKKTRSEVQTEIQTAIAVQNTKIDELTREVREHNNFAKRMPVVETEIKHINKELCHIEDDIHRYHG